jgi:hypothetical protein
MVGAYFGRDLSPGRASSLVDPPQGQGSKGLTQKGSRERPKVSGGSKRSTPKSTQCARDRSDPDCLVFGEDIDMDRVVEFSELAVVGRARGKRLGTTFLRSWVENSWGSKLTSSPCIRLLARGWFSFVFKGLLGCGLGPLKDLDDGGYPNCTQALDPKL